MIRVCWDLQGVQSVDCRACVAPYPPGLCICCSSSHSPGFWGMHTAFGAKEVGPSGLQKSCWTASMWGACGLSTNLTSISV
mmetsp:Transcript_63345/g.112997  ORF Transcript_63345/g.112997 Transcript_63345/m.112997 type:complete len:81 (-) Transcript_63345:849-1091(-)